MLVVQMQVFFGRPNPTFNITDPAVIGAIRERLQGLPAAPAWHGREHASGCFEVRAEGLTGFPSPVRVRDGAVALGEGEHVSYVYDIYGLEDLLG